MIKYAFEVAKNEIMLLYQEKTPQINIDWVLTNELIRGKGKSNTVHQMQLDARSLVSPQT